VTGYSIGNIEQGAQPAIVRPHAVFDKNVCGREHVNISFGGRALIKTLVYRMRIVSRMTAKQTCGRRLGSVCWNRRNAKK